jgi:hypothetical protein
LEECSGENELDGDVEADRDWVSLDQDEDDRMSGTIKCTRAFDGTEEGDEVCSDTTKESRTC